MNCLFTLLTTVTYVTSFATVLQHKFVKILFHLYNLHPCGFDSYKSCQWLLVYFYNI